MSQFLSQRILVSGSTGLVGSVLVSYLQRQGHEVTRLVRPQTRVSDTKHVSAWDPATGTVNFAEWEGQDAVIHLAGAGIAARRWTPSYKEELRESRVASTGLAAGTIGKLKRPPKVFLSASAIGIYGSHVPDKTIDESCPPGPGFLAELCSVWEDASLAAGKAGTRVVNLRIGIVLGKGGGALGKMLPVFRLGLGGPLGDGTQMMSWIALSEIPRICEHIFKTESIRGPVNLTSPHPVSNREFTQTLGKVIHRPTIFPAPKLMIKLALGEMGETLLLNGAKIPPRVLMDTGYRFAHPDLTSALTDALGI